MTTTPRPPRLLMLSTILLAAAGVAVLSVPHGHQPPTATTAPAAPPNPAAVAAAPPAPTPTAGTAVSATPTPSTPAAVESALPPHGEGAAGDPALQQNLEAAWPADLPAADQQELLTAARALLRADATGVGRAQWPDVFGDSRQAVAPAFAAARFRIQAAIARREGSPNKAVVHLVWAGTDRGGTYTDLRITDWHFTHTIEKGAAAWTPQPPT
ncbi:hypothetical protein [Streptomyces cylindrosporus]|uniref:Secreted protein n=1 Tax=Streptomyces cylindrosporus TaxID=2927583 RepID=A0ABS9Y9R1_9ACTN|nr:hypothetical protein [Streptomyces cylindrosporus]MCI3273356.1 hypothetical protein [Streptomyces cylindrosporus]